MSPRYAAAWMSKSVEVDPASCPAREPLRMIRHIVLFRWLPDAAPDEIEAAIERIRGFGASSPECISLVVADNIGENPANFDCAVVADFQNASDYQSYASDPAHRDVIRQNDALVAAKASIQVETTISPPSSAVV